MKQTTKLRPLEEPKEFTPGKPLDPLKDSNGNIKDDKDKDTNIFYKGYVINGYQAIETVELQDDITRRKNKILEETRTNLQIIYSNLLKLKCESKEQILKQVEEVGLSLKKELES